MATHQRPEKVRAMYKDAVRLCPGLYRLPDGNFLICAAEALEDMGLPDTEENRRIVAEVLKEMEAAGMGKTVLLE